MDFTLLQYLVCQTNSRKKIMKLLFQKVDLIIWYELSIVQNELQRIHENMLNVKIAGYAEQTQNVNHS